MTQDNDTIQETAQDSKHKNVAEGSTQKVDDSLAVELLKRNPATIEDVAALRAATFSSDRAWDKLEYYVRDSMSESESDYEQKLAVGLATLGLYELAEEKLENLKDIPLAACLLGRIYKETGRERQAVGVFQKIHERVSEVKAYHIFLIDALESADDMDGFKRELEILESQHPEDPYTLYFKGLSLEREGEYEEAESLYHRALEKDPNLACAHFRLAFRLDLKGRDEEAIECYKRCIESGPSNAAALLNLGLLYEDNEQYDEALGCFEQVTRLYPNNLWARRYQRDVESSMTMYYDEEKEKKEDKQAQILRIPVTDFELSVRSRNCLSKMNIKTLGDLIKKTEAELLAFKNFGETSLQEIKQILAQKNLRLGMVTPETEELPRFLEPDEVKTETDTVLSKPLDELDLSVRSRNCLNFLNIKTLGQLADTTEQQLLACKNFGQTSLNEIRKKLSDFGLSLKV